jgi:hypothetical protein
VAVSVDSAHGHDAESGEGSALAAAAHDHGAGDGPGVVGTDGGAAGHDRSATGAASHAHPTAAGPGDASAGLGGGGGGPDGGAHDHGGASAASPASGGAGGPGGAAVGGDRHHEQIPVQSPASDAPRGTWTEVRYGPFAIPPESAGGGADHSDIVLPSLPKPCSNCFLQQAEPDLVYADGTPANLDTGMMLHHAVLFAAGRQDATCGPEQPFPGKLGQRFFASGNERTPAVFPPGFGYYVDQGNWSGIFHVMNHSAAAKTVFFRLKVRWSPAADGGILPLTPLWLDMNNCQTSEYAVPAGPSSSHWTWTANLTGRIVSTGGHVHNGGIRTTLTNKTTGEHLCTSWAGRGRKAAYQGSIESMSVCAWVRVGTVRRGEVLDLESVYDAPQPVPDAMGIMMAFVYETNDLGAGTQAPPDVRGEGPPPVESTPPPSSPHDHH